jgi:hypothetical protein
MKTYTILNCEGNILQLEIEKDNNETSLTFYAQMNNGTGCVYFSLTPNQLLGFFNSQITLSQIVQNAKENLFLLMRYDKGYVVKKSFVVYSLQCGNALYDDILDDMKMSYRDVAKLLAGNYICATGFK